MLDECFGLADHRYVFLIGGGGKTRLMFTLAEHVRRSGRTIVSTTSTRILYPSKTDAAHVVVEDDVERVVARLRSELPSGRHVTVGKAPGDGDRKLCGFAAEELDRLWQSAVADYLIVEADGAAGRSLKAHESYEPVLSARADLVIAVIGSDCIGRSLGDAHVHRAALFARLCGRAIGSPVTVADVATIFFHPLGYLRAVPSRADVIVLASKASTNERRANAKRLAAKLRSADRRERIARIVIGELTGARPFLETAG